MKLRPCPAIGDPNPSAATALKSHELLTDGLHSIGFVDTHTATFLIECGVDLVPFSAGPQAPRGYQRLKDRFSNQK